MKPEVKFVNLALLLLAGFLFFPSAGIRGETEITAESVLRDPEGKKVGTVRFRETAEGVRISVSIDGLPAGTHALHIHATGSCLPPDFGSAGGHYNPANAEHGFLNPAGPHAGDLPNFTVAADGTADFALVSARVTLREGKKNSLFPEGGTAVVIHRDPDDYLTDPAGMGGPRIACGVIEKISGEEGRKMPDCPTMK
jgi:Cu-Zn family superoxide dismutase